MPGISGVSAILYKKSNLFVYKYILCFFVFIVLVSGTKGQTIIKGSVISDNKTTLSDITVVVHPKKMPNKIIAYSFTDQKGFFSLSFTSKLDTIAVSVKSINSKDTTLVLLNKNQSIQVKLPSFVREIKEVVVKGRAINMKGDTINYRVNAYAQKKDQSIGDVLKRMPGFEVDNAGKVSYQGKPIEKYYIEGMDLLENNYTLANKNLPYTSVASVDVMENHQPVKMLRSRTFSDNTSLNIKLKQHIAFTGQTEIGAGFSPFYRYVNISPMFFTPKTQMITTWQSNNTGDDLSTQHLSFGPGISFEEMEDLKSNLVSVDNLSQPLIAQNRYLNNDANLVSFNQLVKLSANSEIKINTSYYHDKIKESGSSTTSYFLDSNTLTINETKNNRYYKNSLESNITYTNNGEKIYTKEKFGIKKFWDKEDGTIQTDDKTETEKAQTPYFSVFNKLDMLLPVKKNILRVFSDINYNNAPQYISYSPGIFENILNRNTAYNQTVQHYTQEQFKSNNYVQFTVPVKYIKIQVKPGFKYEQQNQKTFIETDYIKLAADSLNNRMNYRYSQFYLENAISYENDVLVLRAEVPLQYSSYHIYNNLNNNSNLLDYTFIEPSFYANWKISSYLTGSGSVGYSKSLGDVTDMANGIVISSYYTLIKNTSTELQQKKAMRYSARLEYKYPISGFFTYLTWTRSDAERNLMHSTSVDANGLYYYKTIKKRNNSTSNSINASISWSIIDWGTTLGLKGFCSDMNADYLLNNQLGKQNTKLYGLTPSLSFSYFKFLGIGYNYTLNFTKQNSMSVKTTIRQQQHKGSINIYPTGSFWLGADIEYYTIKQQQLNYPNTFFTDLTCGYTFKNGISLKLRCNNLFNAKEITQYINSDIELIRSSYSLRSRMFLATMSINLNQISSVVRAK